MKGLKDETVEKVKAGKAVTFEELKPLFRPEGVQNGVMKVDPDKCTGCGLCIQNCPFKSWEMGENKVARLKDDYACFSCSNCLVACPVNAISIVSTYRVEGGYYDTGYPPVRMPEEPKDAKGKPAEWTEVEQAIMNRRSVRNFKDKPVPEPLIRRVLEAGRFAPSAGNMQPFKLAAVTDKTFIAELEEIAYNINAGLYNLYINDDTAMQAFSIVGGTLPTAIFDYRVMIGGFRSVVRRELPCFLNAPCVIFFGSNDKLVGPDLHIGICGQNMNLTAHSLGLGCCWSNFGGVINNVPEMKAKLGFDDEWRIVTTMAIGYPKFKQVGIAARMLRPVTWIRSGPDKPQAEK